MGEMIIKLNIGGGVNHPQHKMKNDHWTFVDIAGKYDVYCDIAKMPLPYKNETVGYIFASNILEHIHMKSTLFVLKEFYRVLKKDGVARIAVPDMWALCKAYIENDIEYWKQSKAPMNDLNVPAGHRVAKWFYQHSDLETGHHNAFDFETLQWHLLQAGFKEVYQSEYLQSKYEALRHKGLDRIMPCQLFVEAVK